MKKSKFLSSVAAAFLSSAAFAAGAAENGPALKLDMAVNGEVRIGCTGAILKPEIYQEGWRGTISCSYSEAKASKAETGTKVYPMAPARSSEKFADGRTTLLPLADGRAFAEFLVTSAAAQKTEGVVLCLTMPCASFCGSTWRTSDGTSGVVSEKWGGNAYVWKGSAEWFEFAPTNGEKFRLDFPTNTTVYLQDNRQWEETLCLRIFSGLDDREFNTGAQRTFSCFVSSAKPGGVEVTVEQPVVVRAGDDWIPFVNYKDIVAGSALDFSNQGLQDAPTGKHGWLRSVNGHFEFENLPGQKQRFYGGNICCDACFPDHAYADYLVTRLVRLGYNSIRIHHFDGTKDGVVKDSADGLTLNAERMDRLDYLLSRVFEKGIYVTLDLYTCRTVKWRDIGIERDGEIEDLSVYKNLILMHEPAYQNWATFTKNLLTHVNPYTGRAYKDEPGIPFISLINEGPIPFWTWSWFRYEDAVRKAWAEWLTERREKAPNFAKGCDDVSRLEVSNQFAVAFMTDMERRFMVRQHKFLKKELGAKALLTNQNTGTHYPTLMPVREDLYDYVDNHFYVDHPDKPYGESGPSYCPNVNPVQMDNLPPAVVAFVRMPTKPYTISEWHFCGPGRYRGAGGIITGAMSAQQDWDALWRFCYSHGIAGTWDKYGSPNLFDLSIDPLALASERAVLCLFLRGDLGVLADGIANRVTKEDCFPADGNVQPLTPNWVDAAWQTRVATSVRAAPGFQTVVDLKDVRTSKTAPVDLKPNPAVKIDRARGSFSVASAKTAGGFAPSGALRAGDLAFDVGDVAATVWASSLDGQPIAKSGRILVSHLTDAHGDGTTYMDRNLTLLRSFGWTPLLMRNGQAKILLALENAADYTVWALETDGRRIEKVPTDVRKGRLSFTAKVKGESGARMLYEVVRERRAGKN